MNIVKRDLQIEVLVNSHGPHEHVRVKEPFCGLQRLGVDCRLHRYPFILPKVIRPHSLVIWQRPRPVSWKQQVHIMHWLRDQGCLLLIEWDDHPKLFPNEIQNALNNIAMAPLKLCHALHTSTDLLARSLNKIQPISYVIPNAIWRIPKLNINKHQRKFDQFRIFIGNQNRKNEHSKLISPLVEWCNTEQDIKIIVIGDKQLASAIPEKNIEMHPILEYNQYRSLMRSCHIALLPLNNSLPNNCKTNIKWMEAASESVAVVGGPGLYKEVICDNEYGLFCEDLNTLIPLAKILKNELDLRIRLMTNAHTKVLQEYNLRDLLISRVKLYEKIWEDRSILDNLLLKRYPELSTDKEFPI